MTSKDCYEVYFLLVLYKSLFIGRCGGFMVNYFETYCTRLYAVCELNLFFTTLLLGLLLLYTTLRSFDDDLFDSYPYFLTLDFISSIFLPIWWVKFGAVEYICACWDSDTLCESFFINNFYDGYFINVLLNYVFIA